MRWDEQHREISVEFGKWPGTVGFCAKQNMSFPREECVEKDDTVIATTKELGEDRQEVSGENSREFLEDNPRELILSNPENDYETEIPMIEDCPRPEAIAFLRRDRHVQKVEILFDAGSDVNLLNMKRAQDFKEYWRRVEEIGEEPWSLLTANASEVKIENYVELDVCLGNGCLKGVRFYLVRKVPVDAVFGNLSMKEKGVCLDWKKQSISIDGIEQGPSWKLKDQPYWRHPVILTANEDFRVPAGHQMVIGVVSAREQTKGLSCQDGLITPTRTKERLDQRFLVGYGYGELNGKIAVFNPNPFPIKIKKGKRVAEFHLVHGAILEEEQRSGSSKSSITSTRELGGQEPAGLSGRFGSSQSSNSKECQEKEELCVCQDAAPARDGDLRWVTGGSEGSNPA